MPGSLGLDIKRLEDMRLESGIRVGSNSSDLDGERTPVVPSAKAMGKRKMAEGDADGDGKRDTPFQVSSSQTSN